MHFYRILLGLAVCALGSCASPNDVAMNNTSPSVTLPPPVVDTPAPPFTPGVASLSGEWRVAGIDGESFDESVGLALRGDADKLWWEPRCAGMARGYRITGSTIAFSSLDPPRGPGDPTPAVCAIGLPPRLDEVFRALDAAAIVKRTPSNGIEISGGGHSVTLFSQ
jgi:hypothetical protein